MAALAGLWLPAHLDAATAHARSGGTLEAPLGHVPANDEHQREVPPLSHAAMAEEVSKEASHKAERPSLRACRRIKRYSLDHGALAWEVEALIRYFAREMKSSLKSQRRSGFLEAPCTPPLTSLYTVGDVLGRGHFGVVRVCQEIASGKKFACKSVSRTSINSTGAAEELECEVATLLKLQSGQAASTPRGRSTRPADGSSSNTMSCPDSSSSSSSSGRRESSNLCKHVVQLHEVLVDSEAVHLILEYCPGGDLLSYVSKHKGLKERTCRHILGQLLETVGYMHSQGIMHRDLKPQNILLVWPSHSRPLPCPLPEVKVADFGLSVRLNARGQAWGIAGTNGYMAPEVLSEPRYGVAAETWSLGATLYQCLTGLPPPEIPEEPLEGECAGVTVDLSGSGPLRHVSPDARNLLSLMLETDSSKRISIEQALVHPWMTASLPTLREHRRGEGLEAVKGLAYDACVCPSEGVVLGGKEMPEKRASGNGFRLESLKKGLLCWRRMFSQ